jgi:hypothetical protein
VNDYNKTLRELKALITRKKSYSPEYARDYLRRNQVGTIIGGRRAVVRVIGKRERPDSCELCKECCNILHYHHWDKRDISKGIWTCGSCHVMVRQLEKYVNIAEEYFALKISIDISHRGRTKSIYYYKES